MGNVWLKPGFDILDLDGHLASYNSTLLIDFATTEGDTIKEKYENLGKEIAAWCSFPTFSTEMTPIVYAEVEFATLIDISDMVTYGRQNGMNPTWQILDSTLTLLGNYFNDTFTLVQTCTRMKPNQGLVCGKDAKGPFSTKIEIKNFIV